MFRRPTVSQVLVNSRPSVPYEIFAQQGTLTLENIRPIAIFRCKIRRFFAIFSKTTQDTETLYTSFESSNIQLFGARSTGAWFISYDSQNPFIETQTFFTKRGVADLFGGPRPLSLELQRAAY